MTRGAYHHRSGGISQNPHYCSYYSHHYPYYSPSLYCGTDSHSGGHDSSGGGGGYGGSSYHHHNSHHHHHHTGGGGGGTGGGHLGGGGSHGAMDATFIWKLSKLGRIGSSRLRFDDDFADRLNYQFSGVLMFLFIGVIGIRQYVGKPIQCWIPQEFTRGWEEYAENYCWVSNTYFSPLPKRLPQDMAERENSRILYYQWAPILMAIQALLFYLPCLIWRLFNSHSGFNVRRIMQMANDSNILLPEHGLKNVRFIARYMEGCIYRLRDYKNAISSGVTATSVFPYRGMQRFPIEAEVPPPGYTKSELESRRHGGEKRSNGEPNLGVPSSRRHRRYTSPLCGACSGGFCSCLKSRSSRRRSRKLPLNPITESSPAGGLASPAERGEFSRKAAKSKSRGLHCCGRKSGNFLVVLYFFVKGLYLINIVGQLILMEKFIGTNTAFYGVRVLIDLLQGSDWHTSGNFPRVTFCDFEAKKLGKNQRYTIQCVLPLNMFLEKIFIFLWFWHCALGIVTLVSFINWFFRMGFSRYRLRFIRRYLKIMCVMKDTDRSASKKFVENFLRPDGIFLIRLISMNVGDMMAGDLACELWHIYRHKRTQDVVATEEMKYIEPMPNYLGHPQAPSLRHHHPEIGFIAAPTAPRSGSGTTTEKIMLNGDDSIV